MIKQDDFFERLIYGLIQGKDVPFLAANLAQNLNRPVIITNAIHRVLVFQNPLNMSIKIEEFFSVPPAKVNEEHLFEGDINLLFNGELIVDDYTYPYMYLPLQAAGHSLGYCIVLNICSDSESFLLKH